MQKPTNMRPIPISGIFPVLLLKKIKVILAVVLFLFIVITFSSCKSCKCPAYSKATETENINKTSS